MANEKNTIGPPCPHCKRRQWTGSKPEKGVKADEKLCMREYIERIYGNGPQVADCWKLAYELLKDAGKPIKSDLTPDELESLNELLKEASDGPWKEAKKGEDDKITVVVGPDDEEIVEEPCDFHAYDSGAFVTANGMQANIDLIVKMREALPLLIIELKRRRG